MYVSLLSYFTMTCEILLSEEIVLFWKWSRNLVFPAEVAGPQRVQLCSCGAAAVAVWTCATDPVHLEG